MGKALKTQMNADEAQITADEKHEGDSRRR
jgi:hypothetical protein